MRGAGVKLGSVETRERVHIPELRSSEMRRTADVRTWLWDGV